MGQVVAPLVKMLLGMLAFKHQCLARFTPHCPSSYQLPANVYSGRRYGWCHVLGFLFLAWEKPRVSSSLLLLTQYSSEFLGHLRNQSADGNLSLPLSVSEAFK